MIKQKRAKVKQAVLQFVLERGRKNFFSCNQLCFYHCHLKAETTNTKGDKRSARCGMTNLGDELPEINRC